MFAFISRTELVIRALLIAVILFNALVPNTVGTQAKQESAGTSNSGLQITKQEDTPFPIFERPEPRVSERSSYNASNTILLANNATENISHFDPLHYPEGITALDKAKELVESFKHAPNPVRAVSATGNDVFTYRAATGRVFTVTTLADTDDGTCDSDCSLREAIYAANSFPGADTIIFSVSGTILIKKTLPHILDTTGLTIDGTGQEVRISGDHSKSFQDESSSGILDTDGTGEIGPIAKYRGNSVSPKVLPRIIAFDKKSKAVADSPFALNPSIVFDPDPEECFFYSEGSLSVPSGTYSNCTVYAIGAVTITNSTFSDSDLIYSESALTISDSTFSNNYVIQAEGSITSTNSTFSDTFNFYSEGPIIGIDSAFSDTFNFYSENTLTITNNTILRSNVYS